jgi:hypothetical protein
VFRLQRERSHQQTADAGFTSRCLSGTSHAARAYARSDIDYS